MRLASRADWLRFDSFEGLQPVLYRLGFMDLLGPIESARESSRFLRLHLVAPKRLERRRLALPRPATSRRVVFSLTTTPDRIRTLGPTLNSLFDQSCRSDAIYLNIPGESVRQGCGYVIPEWLEA